MVNFTKHSHRATPSVIKVVCLVLCIGVITLCQFSRPTSLQIKLIDSVWRENGLYIMGMVGGTYSAASFLIFTLFGAQNRIPALNQVDIILHIFGCLAFVFCGAAILFSALIIMTKIEHCCGVFHEEDDVCDFPGLLDAIRNASDQNLVSKLANQHSRFSTFYEIGAKELMGCKGAITSGSWLCTICVNDKVQPRYTWKGAAGAIGILMSIFYGIIAVVSIGTMRHKKPNFGLRRPSEAID